LKTGQAPKTTVKKGGKKGECEGEEIEEKDKRKEKAIEIDKPKYYRKLKKQKIIQFGQMLMYGKH